MPSPVRRTAAAKGSLQVRRRLWYRAANLPRLEMLTRRGWRSCASYPAAREYARANGYTGIHVTPI